MVDRLIQQAMHQVLSPIFDPGFSEFSYGVRPGRHARQAVQQARQYVSDGRRWVVDLDLEKFFDRVNHDILMSQVARRVRDKRVLRLIRRYLQAGMLSGGVISARRDGTPQGGPLSPLMTAHRQPRLRIAAPVVARLRAKLKTIFRRGRGNSLTKVITELTPILRGWMNYFRDIEVRGVLEALDGWLRRKLRCLLWRHWKRPHTRAGNLMRRGLSEERA